MGVSPTRSNSKNDNNFTSRFNKKKRNQLRKDAKTEIVVAKDKLKKNVKSASWWSSFLKLGLIIIFYFSSSIALTFYQKDLLKSLPFPLTIVVCHLFLKFGLAAFCRQVYVCCFGYCKSEVPEKRIVLPWKLYLQRVLLVAATSALDIGLSQWSLKYITVALYTMTKTTSILFILGFGLALGLEKKHWSQIVIVLLISAGLIMFTFKSTTFSMAGFLLALSGSFLSGARWTFSQLIMQKSAIGLEHPIDLIYHIQPLMILTLLPIAIGIEGVNFSASSNGFRYNSIHDFVTTLILVGIGGTLAFAMEVAEFAIVQIASSLTLSIIGVTKEVVSVTISIMRSGRELFPINVVGMVICLCGISAHVVRKATQPIEVASDSLRTKNRNKHRDYSMLSQSSSESDSNEEIFLKNSNFNHSQNGLTSSDKCDTATAEPLLWYEDESEYSSDEESFSVSTGKTDSRTIRGSDRRNGEKSWNSVGDDFFLRDNRTWTSVKDAQFKMLNDPSIRKEDKSDDNLPKKDAKLINTDDM